MGVPSTLGLEPAPAGAVLGDRFSALKNGSAGNRVIMAERGKKFLSRLPAGLFALCGSGSFSEFAQVIPQDVDAYCQHCQGHKLPEELIRDDQCCYYSQPNVDTADQV